MPVSGLAVPGLFRPVNMLLVSVPVLRCIAARYSGDAYPDSQKIDDSHFCSLLKFPTANLPVYHCNLIAICRSDRTAVFLTRTPVTDALDSIVHGTDLEAIGQIDRRDIYHFKAICLVTDFTIEMRVHISLIPEADDLIFFRTAAILERMDQLLLAEKVQCPENA